MIWYSFINWVRNEEKLYKWILSMSEFSINAVKAQNGLRYRELFTILLGLLYTQSNKIWEKECTDTTKNICEIRLHTTDICKHWLRFHYMLMKIRCETKTGNICFLHQYYDGILFTIERDQQRNSICTIYISHWNIVYVL